MGLKDMQCFFRFIYYIILYVDICISKMVFDNIMFQSHITEYIGPIHTNIYLCYKIYFITLLMFNKNRFKWKLKNHFLLEFWFFFFHGVCVWKKGKSNLCFLFLYTSKLFLFLRIHNTRTQIQKGILYSKTGDTIEKT